MPHISAVVAPGSSPINQYHGTSGGAAMSSSAHILPGTGAARGLGSAVFSTPVHTPYYTSPYSSSYYPPTYVSTPSTSFVATSKGCSKGCAITAIVLGILSVLLGVFLIVFGCRPNRFDDGLVGGGIGFTAIGIASIIAGSCQIANSQN